MSWKSPGFHWNPLKDLKRFSLHISRFLFTPSLLFTNIHYAAYAGSNNDDEDYSVSCEDTWHGRWKKCGSCFFPASLQHHPNSLQYHPNSLQRHPKFKTSKDLCQESLSPVSNWDLVKRLGTKLTWMRVPMWVPMWEEWVWEPTAPFCIRRSSKDGLVMNMNIIEYPSLESQPPKQWIYLKCRKASCPDFWSFCSEFWSTSVTRFKYLRFTQFRIWQQLNAGRQQQPKVRESGFLTAGHSRRWSGSSWVSHCCCSH